MVDARWQRKLSVTADTYTHVLSDGVEIDYATRARAPGVNEDDYPAWLLAAREEGDWLGCT